MEVIQNNHKTNFQYENSSKVKKRINSPYQNPIKAIYRLNSEEEVQEIRTPSIIKNKQSKRRKFKSLSTSVDRFKPSEAILFRHENRLQDMIQKNEISLNESSEQDLNNFKENFKSPYLRNISNDFTDKEFKGEIYKKNLRTKYLEEKNDQIKEIKSLQDFFEEKVILLNEFRSENNLSINIFQTLCQNSYLLERNDYKYQESFIPQIFNDDLGKFSEFESNSDFNENRFGNLNEIQEDENEFRTTMKRSTSLRNFENLMIAVDVNNDSVREFDPEGSIENAETNDFSKITLIKSTKLERFSKADQNLLQKKGKEEQTANNKNRFKESDLKFGSLSFHQNIILNDWLYKKENALFNNWQLKWVVLTVEKFVDYDDFSKNLPSGCISFKLSNCKIALYRKKEFYIYSLEIDKKFFFKAQTNQKAIEWVAKISFQINDLKFYKKISIQHPHIRKYANKEYITEFDFLLASSIGDILLFETNNIGSKIQRKITGSSYGTFFFDKDHVAIVIKIDGKTNILDAQYGSGVEINDWFEYIKINDLFEKVVFRRLLTGKGHIVNLKELIPFARETLGCRYELNAMKLMKKKSFYGEGWAFDGIKEEKNIEKKGYFCSELVASAFKSIGLLDSRLSSCQYWPGTFSSEKKIKLNHGYKFSNEVTILLNKHIRPQK